MKNEILIYQNDPAQLEKLYRTDKATFKQEFSAVYPQLKGNAFADFWNERLNYESSEINWGTGRELLLVIVAIVVAGFIAKVPHLFSIDEDFFYPRNIGFVVFPLLTAYFAWKNKLATGKIALIAVAMLVSLVFINTMFPGVKETDTLVLSCIHLALFLWAMLGFAFVGEDNNVGEKRLGYLKYNGDLVVMTTLILISGGIMSAVTVGLFKLLGFEKFEDFYFQNVAIFGLAGAPIFGTYLTQTNPQLVGKVSPVIAKIFSPLVLVMLVIYLIAMIFSAKDPYNDREFLVIFNALLIGVMAIIFFSVAEMNRAAKSRGKIWILFLLSLVTIVVNSVALSAIVFRISEWGITPNRAAVLGSNLLILVNLLLVATQLYKVLSNKAEIPAVGRAIAYYLPVYVVWTVIVTFVFPFVFGFK